MMPNAFEGVFPIGLGTSRFPFLSSETYQADFENAVDLVLYALERGIDYIDVGKGYSAGKAFSVLKEAFRRTDKAFRVTVKVGVGDKGSTAADYYQEALSILDAMGLERASHFLLWTLMDKEQLRQATAEDGLYSAALRLRGEGRIEHIGASVHMRPDGIIEAIDSGWFEFVLISWNLLNFLDMQRVLDRAYEKGVDILVMNPLYGGLIPENESLFEYAKIQEDETVVQAAVRAVLSHPAVKCVLAGAGNKEELDGYLSAVPPGSGAKDKEERLRAVKERTASSGSYCSYCRYCANCPKGIPVPQIMNAWNIGMMSGPHAKGLGTRIFFKALREKFDVDFESSENPCVKCGQCEKKCTQHLDIIQTIDDTYRLVGRTCYDKASRRRRFDELINGKGYQRIGFWPASAGTMKVLDIYRGLFGSLPFEVFLFDSDPGHYGAEKFGYTVCSGGDAVRLGVDCILITSFQYGGEIYAQIKSLEEQGVDVKTLYRKGDADWWW